MTYEFRLRRRVEFCETDMAGIVHFANFFKYMEACEHAFARSLGTIVHPGENQDGSVIGWPRVHAECDYRRSLKYDEEFDVHLLVREKKERAVHFDFHFWKVGEQVDRPLARGKLVVVSVGRIDGEVKAIALPAVYAEKLTIAPSELLTRFDLKT
jgi:acyl-CoA thioester hydrolase